MLVLIYGYVYRIPLLFDTKIDYIGGFGQDCITSIALAMEVL